MIHELKVWPAYYERLEDGTRTFEVRRDDRGYQSGDTLVLREWKPCGDGAFTRGIGSFTGRSIQCTVGFIFRRGFGCDLGEYVVMSLLFPEPPSQSARDPLCVQCGHLRDVHPTLRGTCEGSPHCDCTWYDDGEP